MSPLRHAGRELALVRGRTIFDYADDLKIRVPTSCGRNGDCHECIVEIRRGMDALSPPSPSEGFLRENYRLACQTMIADVDADVEFAALRRQPRILTQSVSRDYGLSPAVTRRGDSVYSGGRRVDRYRGGMFGLAIDVGTTTVAMNLADLERGEVVAAASFENPQRFGGSDVMRRISYDGGPFAGELRQVMLSAVNFEIGDLARRLGFHRRMVYETVVVGNSTMRDIFFGLDVQPIGEKPYRSTTELDLERGLRQTTALSRSAGELGLRVFPGAHVYGGALIGSHVGADVLAGLLAVGMAEKDGVSMLVDVGTNTEVVLGNRRRMIAASCPAGPAFEGGQVSYGMPGYDGAVESVEIRGDHVEYRTIGGGAAQGICGSGLVDLLAGLRKNGLMNELGVLTEGRNDFAFAPDRGMSISRADISALAQAKSANFAGQYILLRNYGLPLDMVEKLYLAGGFANYLNVASAIEIGFIANLPPEKIAKAGNAALEGATMMLLSTQMRQAAEDLARRVEHVELETTPDFFDIFVEGCLFKPMAQDFPGI